MAVLCKLNLPLRIGEGTRSKLDFDFACGRGHAFGEYHVHGVVNEILCSNLDPTQRHVCPSFPHPKLQTPGASGRRREVDFAVFGLSSGVHEFYAEVKWAGSSHCCQENVLRDLCRLQIIKEAEPTAECIFILAGTSKDIEELFRDGIFMEGTECLLHRTNGRTALTARGSRKRIKNFSLNANANHATDLMKLNASISSKLPSIPDRIYTHLTYSARSAPSKSRFQVFVWSVEASR